MLSAGEIDELLRETSRTFALAVPLLPARTRHAVGLAYLLFRVADTLEDAASWTPAERKDGLVRFAEMLNDDETTCDRGVIADWLARDVTAHTGYRRLVSRLPDLLGEVARLTPTAATSLREHTRRTALGMRDMIDASVHGLRSIDELRAYCYIVAGIVGELLTELFVQDAPQLESVRPALVAEQRAFGEGLQLVNILKDERADAAEGRAFLPPATTRASVYALAFEGLESARRYIAALERGRAPAAFVAFASLPCELAEATLDALRKDGPGAKVPRPRVVAMFQKYAAMAQG